MNIQNQFIPSFTQQTDETTFLHYLNLDAGTETLAHQHPWGQLHLIREGVLEMEVAGRKMIAPNGYVIWTPADTEHRAFNRKDVAYGAINLTRAQGASLSDFPCMLALTPLTAAIIEDLFTRQLEQLEDEQDHCLLVVLLSRLAQASPQDSYLPSTTEPLLQPLIEALEQDPSDNRSLAAWAAHLYTTERTLNRRFRQCLRMSFNEWRLRLKVVSALAMLKQQQSIGEIAFALGYSQSSSFIKMFRNQTGMSPERYREQRLNHR